MIHNSLPELDMEDICPEVNFLGKSLNYPLIINALTGGTEHAGKINRDLAYIAGKYGLAMAVGSQTVAIEDPGQTESFSIVRQTNPEGTIIANVSAASRVEDAVAAVKMIDADGLQLHFNVPQELAMPEGDRSFKGIMDNVARIANICPVPVIAKEVGFGFSREVIGKLYKAGITIFDIGGKGGTNFVVIEDQRRGMFSGDLDDWGISTADSLGETLALDLPVQVIASGGIRKAADAAKALAMGADLAGMAAPFLKTLLQDGLEELDKKTEEFLYRLKAIFLMTGARNCDALRTKPVIIMGDTSKWLSYRGIDPGRWANR